MGETDKVIVINDQTVAGSRQEFKYQVRGKNVVLKDKAGTS